VGGKPFVIYLIHGDVGGFVHNEKKKKDREGWGGNWGLWINVTLVGYQKQKSGPIYQKTQTNKGGGRKKKKRPEKNALTVEFEKKSRQKEKGKHPHRRWEKGEKKGKNPRGETNGVRQNNEARNNTRKRTLGAKKSTNIFGVFFWGRGNYSP